MQAIRAVCATLTDCPPGRLAVRRDVDPDARRPATAAERSETPLWSHVTPHCGLVPAGSAAFFARHNPCIPPASRVKLSKVCRFCYTRGRGHRSVSQLAYLVIREGSKWSDVFRLVPGQAVTIGRARPTRSCSKTSGAAGITPKCSCRAGSGCCATSTAATARWSAARWFAATGR